jgi:hypothetical protein
MSETFAGIIAAVVIIILTRLLSRYFSARLLAASILVAIAFIYVGYSLQENEVKAVILECAIALALYFLALIGYTRNSVLLAYGIMLHGIWDILHHHGLVVKTAVPVYWPSFCFIIDVIDGLYFLVIFKAKLRRNPAH